MKKCLLLFLTLLFFLPISGQSSESTIKPPDMALVFTKTKGWRHKSIEKGVRTLREIGRKNRMVFLQTESSEDFNPDYLRNFKLVVFLSTTLDVLNDKEQNAFENYIANGGAFMGIHAAADTEYDWPWYGKLVGGYFNGHPNDPNVRKANVTLVDSSHIATQHLPEIWNRADEWYNYKNLNPKMTVLLNLDENSYEGGTNGEHHPIAWCHETLGGRAFYTGGGHTKAAFDEPLFRQHLLGGLLWCLKRTE